jgi:hypothetical protein
MIRTATDRKPAEVWGGRIFTGFVTLALTGSAIAKIAGGHRMTDGLIRAGIPANAIIPISLVELFCLTLYLIPRTASVGAVLLTGYFGGVTVTHLIMREPVIPPLIIGLVIWGGAYLRADAFRALFSAGIPRESREAATVRAEQPRFVPWIYRLVLAAATLIFTVIGLRYIVDPAQASAAVGMSLNSALASTTARVGFGAFPLAFAVFAFLSLLSRQRMRAGVTLVVIVIAAAIVARAIGMGADGAAPESMRLFIPEFVILALSLSGLLLDARRAKQSVGGVA